MKQIIFSVVIFANLIFTTLQQNCWNPYYSSQSFGGSPIDSVPSLTSCQTICQSISGCKAVEWLPAAPGIKCFIFYTSDAPTYTNRPGIDHYISSCFCSWVTYNGKQSFGGILETQATDLDKCKNACYYNSNCKAIEWVSNQNSCYLFSTDTVPNINAPEITHYIFQCSTSQGTSDKPAGSCSWSSQSDTGTTSGILQNNVNNLDNCKYVCVQTDGCKMGFDFNTNSQQCWLSTTTTSYYSPGVTHFSYKCEDSSIVSWDVSLNRNSPGGIVQPAAQSVDDCKNICKDSGYCTYGFDWNNFGPLGQQCWISTQFNRTVYQGVDHYTPARGLTPTPGYVSECIWQSYPNSNSPFGTARPYQTTLTVCQRDCLQYQGCKGIDWDEQGIVKCWFSIMDIVLIGAYSGVTHYNFSCPGGSTLSPIPPLTKLGPDCDYIQYPNSGSDGGVVNTYSSDDVCRNQCTVQQTCKAYEWRNSNADNCVLYSTGDPPKYNGNRPGYSYYLFKKCY